jgi:toxin ParE1/3/4
VSAGPQRWALRLSAAAETDFSDIIGWTVERFGEAQARVDASTISAALAALAAEGPATTGAKPRNDIAKGLLAIHVAREGRKGRHFILFRAGRLEQDDIIDVLRILHDSMDLARHLPAGDDDTSR